MRARFIHDITDLIGTRPDGEEAELRFRRGDEFPVTEVNQEFVVIKTGGGIQCDVPPTDVELEPLAEGFLYSEVARLTPQEAFLGIIGGIGKNPYLHFFISPNTSRGITIGLWRAALIARSSS